jgi:hypothetical protein
MPPPCQRLLRLSYCYLDQLANAFVGDENTVVAVEYVPRVPKTANTSSLGTDVVDVVPLLTLVPDPVFRADLSKLALVPVYSPSTQAAAMFVL